MRYRYEVYDSSEKNQQADDARVNDRPFLRDEAREQAAGQRRSDPRNHNDEERRERQARDVGLKCLFVCDIESVGRRVNSMSQRLDGNDHNDGCDYPEHHRQ